MIRYRKIVYASKSVRLRFTTTRHLAIALCATADGSLRSLHSLRMTRVRKFFQKLLIFFISKLKILNCSNVFKVIIFFYMITFFSVVKTIHFQKEECTFNRKTVINWRPLLELTQNTLDFLKTAHTSSYFSIDEGSIFKGIITLKDVIDTADFMVKMGKKHPEWLEQLWFYKQFFDFYRWYPDYHCIEHAGPFPRGWLKPPHGVRITYYHVTNITAEKEKTISHHIPLYGAPSDEKTKTLSYIRAHQEDFTRFKYTRHEIIHGALQHDKKIKLYGWVTLAGYKDLVMQGSGVLIFPDKQQSSVSVAGSNGKEKDKQYFFIEQKKQGPIKRHPTKVEPIADVAFAGNMQALGFGKIIAYVGKNPKTLEQEMRIGVLVDTGAAFKNNLCKLDLFTGYFDNEHLFKQHCKGFPHSAQVYVLIRKK